MVNPKIHNNIFYVTMTGLFYPAILGAFFYYLLENFIGLTKDWSRVVYIVTLFAIVVSFSIDFLYTYVTKKFYTLPFFILDCFTLGLLVGGYKNLVDGLKSNTNIGVFFVCFSIMHILFLVWDTILLPKAYRKPKVILFDSLCILLFFIGYYYFKTIPLVAVVFLCIYTAITVIMIWKEVQDLWAVDN